MREERMGSQNILRGISHWPVVMGVVATVICGGSIVFDLLSTGRTLNRALQEIHTLERANGQIVYLDEVLTMSARMAALTGDLKWEARYWQSVSKLDAALVVPSSQLPEFASHMHDVASANDELVRMETVALEHVRVGRRRAAQTVLFSRNYLRQKKAYSVGLEAATQTVTGYVNQLKEHIRWMVFKSSVLIVVGMLVLVTVWGRLYLTTRRSLLETTRVGASLRERTSQLSDEIAERQETERRLVGATQAAEAANRSKSEFLANMSHEIRTPITAIIGFTDLLLQDINSDRTICRVDALQTIKRNGEHLTKIINDILDLSKIEADKLQLESIECNPADLMMQVVSLMQQRAVDVGLYLKTEWIDELPARILSDPTRLRQVLMNLIGNAIKFTETGGVTVRVGLRSADDRELLWVEVIDTGIGISEQQKQQLFQPFSQADTSTTRKYGGTGLGLTVSQRLVDMLGGQLEVTSRQGAGSTFSFAIPIRRVEVNQTSCDSKQPTSPPTEKSTSLDGLRILLAEDGPDNQRLISFVLKKAGAQVTLAENGAEAVQRALDFETEFDLILMDMQMPVLDGYGATRRLRDTGYDGPIVALTAHAMQGDREKCLEAGCDDYLTKPLELPIFFQVVRRHAQRSQPCA